MSTTNASGAERAGNHLHRRWRGEGDYPHGSFVSVGKVTLCDWIATREGMYFIPTSQGYLCSDGQSYDTCWHESEPDHPHGWYKTREEAEFRLLLATSPHLALAAFLRGTAGVKPCGGCKGSGTVKRLVTPYDSEAQDCPACHCHGSTEAELREAYRGVNQGTCERCGGDGICITETWATHPPCTYCHGTGGAPSADLLRVASDWMEEHERQMECDVLRSLIPKESENR